MAHDSEHLRQLRLLADGELDGVEAETLERSLASDNVAAQRVRSERRLREQVGRAMSGEVAPRALHARVAAIFETKGHAEPDEAETGRVVTARQSFWAGPTRANVFAVAASLALVVGAVLFGIFGPPIGSVPREDPAIELVRDVASHVADQHHRIARGRAARLWTTVATAEAGLETLMGPGAVAVDFAFFAESRYAFNGAVPSLVNGRLNAGHLLYRLDARAEDGCSASFITLMIVPDVDGSFAEMLPPVRSGDWFEVLLSGGERRILCASDGRFGYFLACCNGSQMPDLARFVASQVVGD